MTGPAQRDLQGWHVSATGVRYPPEPWYLGGSLVVSTFRVPMDELPNEVHGFVPRGHKLLSLGGHAIVGAAFAHYVAGGVLRYDELLIACAVVSRGRVRFTIPHIRVSSESSMNGGRELWGIPKGMAHFDRQQLGVRTDTAMVQDGRQVASLSARLGRRLLPGTHKVPLPTAQRLNGRTAISKNLILGTVRSVRTTWEFTTAGTLKYLAGRKPVMSIALTDSAILFGTKVDRS